MDIRYAKETDMTFWLKLDKHIAEAELRKKIRDRQGYVLLERDNPVGILRYNLFWDNIPFCTMLYIAEPFQRKGYGKLLLKHWEKDMKQAGYDMLMTSTQADETAQHFYRKLGYQDAGGLIINVPKYRQPMEIIFIKEM